MSRYNVTVIEEIVYVVRVEAESVEDAERQVQLDLDSLAGQDHDDYLGRPLEEQCALEVSHAVIDIRDAEWVETP